MKHVLEIVLNFNMRSFLKFCDCMHKKIFFFHKPSFRSAGQNCTITQILIYSTVGVGGSGWKIQSQFHSKLSLRGCRVNCKFECWYSFVSPDGEGLRGPVVYGPVREATRWQDFGLFLMANSDRRPWDSHWLNKGGGGGGRDEEGPLASSPGQGLASSTNCE